MPLTVNRYHAQVIGWVRELGLEHTEEYPVMGFSLDIYLPEIRFGIELDGPQHNKTKDEARDALIFDLEGIRVIRFKVGTPKDKVIGRILDVAEEIASQDA